MRPVKIVQGPAVLRPTCPLRPGTHTDVGTPFCFLTTITSKYSCKKPEIWLSVNAKIGLVYRVNPGLHVWAANDESLQMPQWAVCHTERRGRSWGASPTPGQAEWQKKKHTHTHAFLSESSPWVFAVWLQGAAVWEVMNELPGLLNW